MSQRLGGIHDIDPLTVQLPAGTEVTTRVDRLAGDRVVTRGAVGRVTGLDGDWVDVDVVGIGPLRFRRDEVTPRKQGLLRYARRREDAWLKLAPCIVLDYDLPDNPGVIRAIHDELREIEPQLFLGPAMLKAKAGPKFVLWFALDTSVQSSPTL